MTQLFTVISPMYNVERYLDDFFGSLESQSYGFERLQVILVDDGSTDGTLRVANDFQRRHPSNVTVISKANGGQASARNVGLRRAEGEWLTFPDPDDVLSVDYFADVARTIRRDTSNGLSMVSTRLLMWFEADDSVRDTHALRGRFRRGRRVVNLDVDPVWIQPHITSGFVRRAVVADAQLEFPEELRLRFEDGNFVARYLLNCEQPVVAFVPSAHYLYRQRADLSSTIQSSAANPGKYTDTIRYGFFGVISEAEKLGRSLPRWAQNLFLYDQFWILRSSQTGAVRQASFPASMYDELDELIPDFLRHIDEEAIREFALLQVPPWMREALLLAKQRGDVHSTVYWGASDARRGLRQIVYRYAGHPPVERLFIQGREVEPRFSKTQDLEYAGRPIIHQRSLWVPDDAQVRVELDGAAQPEPAHQPHRPARPFVSTRDVVRRLLAPYRRAAKAVERRARGQFMPLLRRDMAIRSRRLSRRFADAWVFIDRDTDANDSAEDLYWWVHQNQPELNAWFVVRRESDDWTRLAARGARLVAYGSPEFFALLVNARHLASSHADRFITDALPAKLRPAGYVFTFLQHGVIKGDLSLWLNPKRIDVFITSTEDEYRYIAGPSPYRFGTKEVRLTGLPRFDVLREIAENIEPAERRVILIMPTWRDYLVGAMEKASDDRATVTDFESTAYARSWMGLLMSPLLEQATLDRGHRVVFMPHPNMHDYLDRFAVPAHVETVSYADADVRDLLARANVVITDYSSNAFNAAYLNVPIVYFQFDRDDYNARHTERQGYFDYERDGFGPVAETVAEATREIGHMLEVGLTGVYRERVSRAFPVRDGKNRERVFAAMLEATRARPLDVRSTAASPDGWQGDRGTSGP